MPVDFQVVASGDEFSVRRSPIAGVHGQTYAVTFVLRVEHIHVTSDWQRKNEDWFLRVTLNDSGECRITIDNEGEYLRWQVARRMLCGLLFEGPHRG